MKTVGILGAGWLGKPLALFLQDKGHQIKVSVRSEEKKNQLEDNGLNAFVLQIDENAVQGAMSFFKDLDVLIVSLTPQPLDIFKTLLQTAKLHNIQKVLLFSSTGIYTDCSGEVNEDSLLQTQLPKVKLLKEIEDLFLNEPLVTTTVLRLGGLIGPNRHPIMYMVKKGRVEAGNEPVNIVYQETILQTIAQLLSKGLPNTVFNLVENDHRTKEIFYTEAALAFGLQAPEFINESHPKNRIVSTKKLHEYLN
ncbi:MAG TPA: NAD(P)H-binding protein [Flavobacterium sp.]|nr:NAD(P)H-binding protein [Flavobacterium sp.]